MSQQMRQRRGQPLFILNEDTERTQGKDAQSSNITAGKAVSESVRTTLGPRGMDKMLVSDSGDVVITNDGATILQEMDIEHPAAQMIVEVAETQEEEVGDGTTTASVLAGQLLAQAEDLIDDDIHPTTIVEGYQEASRLAVEAIEEVTLADELDDESLTAVAESSMTGKGTGDIDAANLAETVVAAVQQVRSDAGVDRDAITIRTQTGAGASATELVQGVISEEEPLHDDMPRTVEDASIGVLDVDLEVREAEIDAEYDITNVDQLNAAIEAEESELRGYADAVADVGVDVVFVTGDVDDLVASYLAKEGILAFDSVDDDEARSIVRTAGARHDGDRDRRPHPDERRERRGSQTARHRGLRGRGRRAPADARREHRHGPHRRPRRPPVDARRRGTCGPHKRGPVRRRRRPRRTRHPRPRRGQARGGRVRHRGGDDDRPHRRRDLRGVNAGPPRRSIRFFARIRSPSGRCVVCFTS